MADHWPKSATDVELVVAAMRPLPTGYFARFAWVWVIVKVGASAELSRRSLRRGATAEGEATVRAARAKWERPTLF